jgi:hypothetical protein
MANARVVAVMAGALLCACVAPTFAQPSLRLESPAFVHNAEGVTKDQLLAAINGHVITEAKLVAILEQKD